MINNLNILPLLIPLLTGTAALLRYRIARRAVTLAAMFVNMVVCFGLLDTVHRHGILVSQMGGHPAPFGISLVIDPLSAIMLCITSVIAFIGTIYSWATIDHNRERFAYYPLLAFLIMGVNFAFLTGDLFTLYVAFEVMLMASFVLLTLGGERGQIEGGLKYVTLNLISSTIFLVAVGLTYSVAGTLNMAHIAQRLADVPSPGITTVLAVLFLIAFGIKAAIFPLFFWLPASYHTPPIAVTAIFGALLTKVGVYSLWRVLGMIFPQALLYLQPLLLLIAGLTMVTGVLGAIAQTEVRRLLSFHIISQIGYLIMGLALLTPLSLAGAVFFMVHVILSKTALFLVSGVAHQLRGTYDLKKLGYLAKTNPGIATLFLIPALSLAGIPPFSGFWAKMVLVRAGLEAQQYLIVIVGLVVSLLTFYSMTKIWNEAYWKEAPDEKSPAGAPQPDQHLRHQSLPTMLISTVALVALVIAIGVLVEPLFTLSQEAANVLANPSLYVNTVLTEVVP